MFGRTPLFLTVALALMAGSACSRREAGPPRVEAATSWGLVQWRNHHRDQFSPDEWREFDGALQEIRLGLMAANEATGSNGVDEAMRMRIDGRTFPEVLRLGYEAKRRRLQSLRDELKRSVDGNAYLVARSASSSDGKYLDALRARQTQQLRDLDTEIDSAERNLARLGDADRERALEPRSRDVTATPLTRERASAEISSLLETRRREARARFGASPVKFARDAEALPAAMHDEFVARQAAAQQAGRVVIAVLIDQRWLIYDAPKEEPGLSPAALANLTDADRRQISDDWSLLQAEIWARRQPKPETE